MKIPKTFRPNQNLDKKIKEALEKVVEKEEVDEEKKRQIHIGLNPSFDLEDNMIYARIRHSDKEEYINGYFLELISLEEFYFPVSDNPIDWGRCIRKRGTAFLKNENSLLNYLRLLEENNDAILCWQNDKRTLELKQKFEGIGGYLDRIDRNIKAERSLFISLEGYRKLKGGKPFTKGALEKAVKLSSKLAGSENKLDVSKKYFSIIDKIIEDTKQSKDKYITKKDIIKAESEIK